MFRLTSLVAVALLLNAWFVSPRPFASVAAASQPLRIGAVFPLHGPLAPLARQEYRGVQIARELMNQAGGISGRQIALDTQELDAPDQANAAMKRLRRTGTPIVLGAYSSQLSIPASAAAHRQGLVYWEAGAVADRLTGRGLPGVFRIGASGSNLGSNSANFVANQLAWRLHKPKKSIRIVVVSADDDYALSVAGAAIQTARARGMHVVKHLVYSLYGPNWSRVITGVRKAHANVLILASHIRDGVAFRRAMLAAHIHADAFVGSTMAQCVPEFGVLMGREAIGVFASDRPGQHFNAGALRPGARSLYHRFSQLWRRQTGQGSPTEEGLAGFTAAWALFHYVLPQAARHGKIDAAGISRSAQSLNLPTGTLPNGAGIRFAASRQRLGQNLRAAAVIWQWQAFRHSVVVWPAVYATGRVKMVPLPH